MNDLIKKINEYHQQDMIIELQWGYYNGIPHYTCDLQSNDRDIRIRSNSKENIESAIKSMIKKFEKFKKENSL